MPNSYSSMYELLKQPTEAPATDTLFAAARVIVDSSDRPRWADGGGSILARLCDPVTGLAPACCVDPADPLPDALGVGGPVPVDAAEFVTGRSCTWMSHDELLAVASQALSKYGSQSVAAWWFTQVATAAAPATVLPMGPEPALPYLVGQLAVRQGASVGTIIATPQVAQSWWQAGGLVRDKAGKLRTAIGGHLVIADGGFNGFAPGGTAPAAGVSWAYAVGAVDVLVTATEARSTPQSFAETMRTSSCGEAFTSFYAAVLWQDNCPPASVPVQIAC